MQGHDMRTVTTLSSLALITLLAACSGEPATAPETAPAAPPEAAAPTAPAIATDRAALITLVDDYMAALVAHDATGLAFAPDAVFVENAERKNPGEGFWQSASAVAGDFKIYVPDPAAGQVGFLGMMQENGAPVLVALRLQVEKGAIVAAEHLIARDLQETQLANLQTVRAGLLADIPEAQRKSRSELLSIGYSYYDALDLNDGSLAPFAEDCTRFENGWQTANIPPRGGDDPLSVIGEMQCGPQLDTGAFLYIDRINNRRVFIADPQTGLVFGLSHFRHAMEQNTFPITGVEGVSSREMTFEPFDLPAAHIFKVGADGLIHEIEAMGFMLPYQSSTGWGW
jgi:hypothetical protein